MAVEVVEKRKGSRSCNDCGAKCGPGDTSCPECGSGSIKKSVVIVRKETSVEPEVTDELIAEIEEALEDEDSDDEDEVVDEEESDDDDEYEEVDEVSDEDEPPADEPPVEKSFSDQDKALVQVEAFSLANEFAEKVSKAVLGENPVADYETVMNDFNNVLDEASKSWIEQSSPVTKSAGDIHQKADVVRQKITNIIKSATEGGVMPKNTRPSALDGIELPDDVQAYIASLEESAGVSKADDDIYKGLTPEVAEIVKKSEAIIEEREQEKWLGIAKSFEYIPGDKDDLAKSLRALSNADPDAYENLKKSLDAANEAAKNSDITKSFGKPGGGEPTSVVEKRRASAKSLVEAGQFQTVEQAEVHLLTLNPSEYGQN